MKEEAALRKELGLGDLVLAQVLCVVGSTGSASRPNWARAHVVFWLAAMLAFYVPLAAVVIYLNRLMPLEGGLYQWAKQGFGEMAGFLTAWNLWVYAVIVTGAIIFVVPTDLSYMLGPSAAWLPGSKIGDAGPHRRGDGRHHAGGGARPRHRQVAAQRGQRDDPAGVRDSAGPAGVGAAARLHLALRADPLGRCPSSTGSAWRSSDK